MPWKIEKSGDAWKVIEEAGGKHPGKVFGTFDSESKAKKQLAALEKSKVQSPKSKATQIPGELPTGNAQLTSRGFRMADKLYRCVRAVESADDLTKTIQVAFSSEYPVKRIAGKIEEKLGAAKRGEEYLEILSHETGDADFSALNRTAPVLDEHKDEVQIGNVKLAKISKDKKGRAVLEFDGLTDLSNLRYEQLKRKKRSISVGYDHVKYLGEGKLSGGKIGKRFSWAADEVSTVARPADVTAGAKRSADEQSACIGCGEMFDEADLDENFMCEECRCEPGRVKPGGDERLEMLSPADEDKLYRTDAEDEGTEISHNDLKSKVAQAADRDPRFKTKRDNGDVFSNFYVHDIHQIVGDEDGDDWLAIIVGPDYKVYEVEFIFDGETVSLGEEEEVELEQSYEPVRRCADLTRDGRLIRSGKEPYGEVEYADTGHQKDKKKRYPIDTKKHVKAAWSYINMEHNAGQYSADDLAKVKGKIKAAAKKFNIDISDKSGRSAPDARSGQVDSGAITTNANNLPNKTMKLKIGTEELEIGDQTQLDAAVTRSKRAAREELLQRRKSIREFADEFIKELPSKRSEIIALADAADADAEQTPEQFSRKMVFVEMPKLRAVNTKVIDEEELHDDINEYSIARAIRSAVEQNKQGAIPTGLEGEVHAEMVKRSIGCSPQGFWVPFNRKIKTVERMTRSRLVRAPGDMQVGVFGQGGALVPTELQIPVIEILRNKMVTERLGVRTIAGLEGFIAWPRQIGTCGAYFVPETFALVVSNPQLDQLMGTPHRIGVTGAYSKQLILQSAIDIENFMRDDQMKALAVKIDQETLLGSGNGDEPIGIFNVIGIGSVNFGGAVTYQKVVNFKTQLALANASVSDMAYVTTPLVEEKWRTTPKVGTTFPIFIWEDGSWGDDTADGRVIGLRATATNQLVNDRVGFGNFADAQKLMWGGLDILVNPFTRSKEAVVEITTNAWMDVMVRHQGSFAYSVDAGDQ